MLRKEKNGVVWLEYESFQQFTKLKHGIFLKHGGKSTGQLSSLNLSYHVGDMESHVIYNEKKILGILDIEQAIRGKLCHGNRVIEVNDLNPKSQILCDGLTTQLSHVGLLVTHADCQAGIFYDPMTHSLAVVHSGWRGNVQNIYAETVYRMQSLYGSSPENIHVGISPSLGPQDAEFIHFREELPEPFWDYQIKPTYFNFWEISKMQLQNAGLLPHHIEIAEISTYANPQDYYSYRREKNTGRHGSVAALL